MIRNKYLVKLYVKLHYMWYYINHPKMWWKIRKIRDKNLRQAMNLYIGRIKMVDNEHDEIDVPKLINWVGLGVLGGLWWYSLFTNGLGVTVIWTVVVVALLALWFTMRDNRV